MKSVLCPYCAGEAEEYLSSKDINRRISDEVFHLRHCNDCELLFIANPPANLGDYYYGQEYHSVPKNIEEFNKQKSIKNDNMNVLLDYKKSGSLLEIGPSIGYFCALSQDAGFDVSAIEMDEKCVAFLNDTLKVNAIQSNNPAEILEKDETQYDVICLWHSIEHMSNPWEVLEKAAMRLKPEGVLLVSAPNPMSRQAKMMGKYWPHHDIPRHLFGISIGWLESFAEKNGLTTVLKTTRSKEGLLLNRVSWGIIFKNITRKFPNKLRALSWYIGINFARIFSLWDNKEGHGSAYIMIFRNKTMGNSSSK